MFSHWIHSYWMFVYSLNGLCVNAVCHLSGIGSSVSSRGVHAKPRWATAYFNASVAFKEVQCECQCWFVWCSSWSFRIPLCWLVSSCVPCHQVYRVTEAWSLISISKCVSFLHMGNCLTYQECISENSL